MQAFPANITVIKVLPIYSRGYCLIFPNPFRFFKAPYFCILGYCLAILSFNGGCGLVAYSNKCSLKGGGVSNVCSGLLFENCSPTVYLGGELLGGRAVVLTNQELPGDRDRNMETLLRQLLDLVTEQAEITNGQVGLIKQDLTGLDKSSLYDVAHASGVVSGRLQVLRAIESLLVDYTK